MCGCTSRDLVTEGFGLFAVACHALLDGHRIAAEVRHEGLALLGLARDDARVGVVDNEQSHAAGCRAELLDRRLDLRARRLHAEGGGASHRHDPQPLRVHALLDERLQARIRAVPGQLVHEFLVRVRVRVS